MIFRPRFSSLYPSPTRQTVGLFTSAEIGRTPSSWPRESFTPPAQQVAPGEEQLSQNLESILLGKKGAEDKRGGTQNEVTRATTGN